MMRGCWARNRAMWPKERIKAEAAEIRTAPSMGRLGSCIPPGRDGNEMVVRLAQRAAEAERRREVPASA